MTFSKGQSGNPGGRPAAVLDDGRTIADVAREHTVGAIQTLAAVMNDGESDAARVSAANAILDRGWGRPKQDIDLTVDCDRAEVLSAARARLLASREPQ